MVAGWYVVKFIDEKNIIEVIPSNWIINFEKCFWPNKFGSLKLQSAIKNKSIPCSDWKSYPIKVISKQMFLNYKEASKFADKTLAESSSETDQIKISNQSIKRKKKDTADNYYNSESSSEEEQSLDSIPVFPKFSASGK